MKLSPFCFGCEPLGGTDWGNIEINDIAEAINTGLELGVNFFDTGGVYGLGLSEERLSNILGKRRHDVVIATKGGLSWTNTSSKRGTITKDSSVKKIRQDIESSLRRLRLETLPIFYVHWPDENTKIEDTFFELSKIKDEGKINSIGCSNFTAEQIEKACTVSKVDYIQTPLSILTGSLNSGISEICSRKNIKVIAYNVLMSGLLTGKFNLNSTFPKNDRRSRLPLFMGEEFKSALKKVDELKLKATKRNQSLSTYSINWALKEDNVSSVVIGIKNSKQMKDNWIKNS